MKKTLVKRPTVYRRDYDEVTATKILKQISMGKSLNTICKDREMPSYTTIHKWLEFNDKFANDYAQARQDQADWYADKITEIAEATLAGRYKAENARVAIDALKWTASKLKPKKYGEHLDITSDGEKIEPLVIYRPTKLPDVIDGEVVRKQVDSGKSV
jgi:hypothetical protein